MGRAQHQKQCNVAAGWGRQSQAGPLCERKGRVHLKYVAPGLLYLLHLNAY
jgi:hypothetical protein